MGSVYDWNSTAASNTAAPPAGFPVGQPPSIVHTMFEYLMAYLTDFSHSTLATGTADALIVTLANAPASLTDGMEIKVRAAAANATATPTLKLNGFGPFTITKLGGVALAAGDIPWPLAELVLRYNFTNTRWELLNPRITLAPLRGYLSGCNLANDSGTPTTSIDISAGVTTSDDQTTLMTAAAMVKSIAATWALGPAGGLDTGVVAPSSWYHVFIIQRLDTGVVDALLSLSATAPTMPANYTVRRRIGAIRTDGSSHIIAFIQYGDRFRWGAPVLDANNVGATTGYANLTLNGVPPGVLSEAFGNIVSSTVTVSFHVRPSSGLDGTPSATTTPLFDIYAQSAGLVPGGKWSCVVDNTTQVVSVAANGNGNFYLTTEGYTDYRGRFA